MQSHEDVHYKLEQTQKICVFTKGIAGEATTQTRQKRNAILIMYFVHLLFLSLTGIQLGSFVGQILDQKVTNQTGDQGK